MHIVLRVLSPLDNNILFREDVFFDEGWKVVFLYFCAVSDTDVGLAPDNLVDRLHGDVILHNVVERPVHVVSVVLAAEGDASLAAPVPDPHPDQ